MVVTPNAAAARVDHTYLKRGVYYFNRRVPLDVSRHYKSRRINFSLRTKSVRAARQSVTAITAQLEGSWQHPRLRNAPVPGAHLLCAVKDEPANDGAPRFSEATDLYLRLKGQGKAETFHRAAARACRYLTQVVGDKPLSGYVRADAAKLRDRLVGSGLAGSSVSRLFTTVKSIFNFACMETGLELKNPFAGLYLDRERGVSARKPIPVAVIKRVQAECVHSDDPLRWAAALLSDTGMRLVEVMGLAITDIHLDCATPFIDLKPTPWRRLKTESSTRKVPLAGAALWAATRICDSASSEYAFPSNIRDGTCLSNSASGTLNNWLRKYVPAGCTVHSFRHSMRDRLRAVECSKDIVDQIGGWASISVGEAYGDGYPLEVLSKWITRACHQDLTKRSDYNVLERCLVPPAQVGCPDPAPSVLPYRANPRVTAAPSPSTGTEVTTLVTTLRANTMAHQDIATPQILHRRLTSDSSSVFVTDWGGLTWVLIDSFLNRVTGVSAQHIINNF